MSFTVQKNLVVRAKFPGVNVYTDPERKSGKAMFTSEFATQLLGVTTGKVDTGGIDEQVQIVWAVSADPTGLRFGWVEDDLVTYDAAPGTIVDEQPAALPGSGLPGDPNIPSSTDKRQVANPSGGTVSVTLDDLYELIKQGQQPTTSPNPVPVWAWVALGVVFVAGVAIILVNRN